MNFLYFDQLEIRGYFFPLVWIWAVLQIGFRKNAA